MPWKYPKGLSLLLALASAVLLLAPAQAQTPEVTAKVAVEKFELDNGMKFLLVKKPELSTVTAGWVAHVGSSNERPGITGLTHLFEHMMFKGTKTIGTKNITRDLQIIDEQEKLQERIREIYEEQRARWRRGEIADPFAPAGRTPEQLELEKKFQALVDEQRSLMIKDEFSKQYTQAGGTGLNAFTNQDMTVYFISVPANKVELWFWLEADRLANLVLREFYSERDVVTEERRLRTESTPTGRQDEQFEAMFWNSHPYKWPVIGWPSDLKVISKAQAEDYYNTFYSPNNVTAVLVGNFDPAQAKSLAQKYFGSIPRGRKAPPPVVTLELPQVAEKRLKAECDCQPEVEVRYHTVGFGHKDSFAMDLLGALLSGRTGRLTKSLVNEKKIATHAGAGAEAQKWAGYFSFDAEPKGDATPEQLEQAWYGELKKVIDEPIPAEELQKIKNQIAGTAYRKLVSPFGLLVQLLISDGLGDWEAVNTDTARLLAVTADDIKRVAKTYLTPENRAVKVFTRRAGTAADPLAQDLAGIPDEMRPMIQAQLTKIKGLTDQAKIEQSLAQIAAGKGQAPADQKPVIELMEKALKARLAELKAAPPAQGGQH